jgi:hypothetical protein
MIQEKVQRPRTHQEGEVQETQRAEWIWRKDHLNVRVYATNCERFTLSCSLPPSLCPKCKPLLLLKSFTNAIKKKVPLDKNLKFTNKQYLNPVLVHLYAKVKGLRWIIKHPVSNMIIFHGYFAHLSH